jgi:geranylgeranyl diphosphate synthase, type II
MVQARNYNKIMSLPQELEAYRQKHESFLEKIISDFVGPAELIEAMTYSLQAGGKRIRPILLLTSFELINSDGIDESAELAACALEFVHTYSLIHDDLPAMDDDDYRRGKPSCHKKFGEAVAILAGDALQSDAYSLLAQAVKDMPGSAAAIIGELALAGGSQGMVGGQTIDMVETGKIIDRERLEQLNSMKTGALLSASIRIGAMLAGADDRQLLSLSRFGTNIGLLFQVVDDLLDVTSNRDELGKSVGKDQEQGKNTYASLLGIAGARELSAELAQNAIDALEPFGDKANNHRVLTNFLVQRTY